MIKMFVQVVISKEQNFLFLQIHIIIS